MTPAAILALVAQILALAPTLLQAAAAVKQLTELVKDGTTPTDEQISALLDDLKSNSGTIAALAAADAQEPDPQP